METKIHIRRFLRPGLALFAILTLGLGGPGSAFGQAFVHRGRMVRQGDVWVEHDECGSPVKGGSRMILRAGTGTVRINTVSVAKVTCQVMLHAFTQDEAAAQRLFSGFSLGLRRLPDGGVFLNGVSPAGPRRLFRADYQIEAPETLNLDLETRSGNISVNGLVRGSLRATTAAGNIQIGRVSGPIQVATAGGNVTLGNAGSWVEVRTAGGTIRIGNVKGDATLESNGGGIVAGQITGRFRAETAGGDIALKGADGPIRAVTSGGQIQVGSAGQSVRAETAGGSVRIQGAHGQVQVQAAGGSIDLFKLEGPVQAETRRGSIVAEIAAERKAFNSSLETSTGDIQVYLPQTLPITIDATIRDAAGHRIISDFPLVIQGGHSNLLQNMVRGHAVLNGGGEVLRIRCVGGNIEIYKLDESRLKKLKVEQTDYWKRAEPAGP